MVTFCLFSYAFILFTAFSFFSCNYSRLSSLFFFSICFFFFFCLAMCFFQKSALHFQWLVPITRLDFWNFSYVLGIDGLSLYLIALSSFLIVFCCFNYWMVRYQIQWYFFLLAISLWFLANVFTVLDLIFFFFFFEAVVVPMYLFVGIWGSRVRKIYAAYQLFIYTIIGSFFMLVSFFDVYLQQGSASLLLFDQNGVYHEDRQLFLWIFLLLGFVVKLPTFPVHIWLPEAHVEAPTPGSILLAGVILKLGSYGLLRFFFGTSLAAVTPEVSFWIFALSLLGFVYGSLVALNQQDLKKTVAYSSIAHMNFSLLGLFSGSVFGILGSIFLALGHGICAAGLFFGIGVLYDRYKSRLFLYYGGLGLLMPLFSVSYFFLILANFGFPGTLNFSGEFFLIVGFVSHSLVTALAANFGLILTLLYSLAVYNRVFFGQLKINNFVFFCDSSRLEFYLVVPLIFLIIIGGVYPQIIVNFFYAFVFTRAL